MIDPKMDYCTLYIDGSGDQNWKPPVGKSEHTFHTIGGLVLEPNVDLKGKQRVCELLATYIPEATRSIRPESEYELHYTAITGGAGVYRKMPENDRNELIKKTFELILELKPILIASTVDKVTEWNRWGSKAFPPEVFAMRSVVHKFSMHLNRRQKIGTVVYDADKYNFDRLLQEEVLKFRKYGITITGMSYSPPPDRLPNILNNINFCPSHLSSGLQLADFVASAVWRKYERNDSKWYDMLYPLWEYDEKANKTYRDHIIS